MDWQHGEGMCIPAAVQSKSLALMGWQRQVLWPCCYHSYVTCHCLSLLLHQALLDKEAECLEKEKKLAEMAAR